MRRSGRWLALTALAAMAVACLRPVEPPVPRLADLVAAYDRDVAPCYPFTASERGLRGYDRVLANDIGEEYRRGLKSLCARYRTDRARVDPAALADRERLTRDIFAHRLDTCVESLGLPWHLLPINQTGQTWPSRFPVVGAGRGNHPFETVQNYLDFLGRVDGSSCGWTPALTPDEIHELGLREVARLQSEIERLRADIAAAGEPPPIPYRSRRAAAGVRRLADDGRDGATRRVRATTPGRLHWVRPSTCGGFTTSS